MYEYESEKKKQKDETIKSTATKSNHHDVLLEKAREIQKTSNQNSNYINFDWGKMTSHPTNGVASSKQGKSSGISALTTPDVPASQFDWGSISGYLSRDEIASMQQQGGVTEVISETLLAEPIKGSFICGSDKLSLPESARASSNPLFGRQLNIPNNLAESIQNGFGIDPQAIQLRESSKVAELGAKATAQGNTISFAPGQYNPDSKDGLKVLGHELNHVREQAQGKIKPNIEGTNIHFDPVHETYSDRVGELLLMAN